MKTVQYKKEYCQMLIDHMSKGYSFSTFGADINQGRQTLYDWVERFPEFAEAKKIGQEKAQKFFETMLLLKTRGKMQKDFDPKKSDTACLIFALKTRFKEDYSEKTELEISGKKINIEITDNDSKL